MPLSQRFAPIRSLMRRTARVFMIKRGSFFHSFFEGISPSSAEVSFLSPRLMTVTNHDSVPLGTRNSAPGTIPNTAEPEPDICDASPSFAMRSRIRRISSHRCSQSGWKSLHIYFTISDSGAPFSMSAAIVSLLFLE